MSSLVLSGPAGKLLLVNGQARVVTTQAKNTLEDGEVVCCSEVAGILEVVNDSGQKVTLVAKAFGSYAGADLVLVMGPDLVAEVVGAGRQPVTVLPILSQNLVD